MTERSMTIKNPTLGRGAAYDPIEIICAVDIYSILVEWIGHLDAYRSVWWGMRIGAASLIPGRRMLCLTNRRLCRQYLSMNVSEPIAK